MFFRNLQRVSRSLQRVFRSLQRLYAMSLGGDPAISEGVALALMPLVEASERDDLFQMEKVGAGDVENGLTVRLRSARTGLKN